MYRHQIADLILVSANFSKVALKIREGRRASKAHQLLYTFISITFMIEHLWDDDNDDNNDEINDINDTDDENNIMILVVGLYRIYMLIYSLTH